jgi:Glycosyl hydrolases family 43
MQTEMAARSCIRPGQPWLDTTGNRIQAHGGSVHHENGTFFWYGENKERTVPGSGIWHWGVRCYSSTDLYNWTDLGLIIPPVEHDPESPLHPAQKMDRPHIIYNAATGKYVCWVKVMGEGDVQRSTVLTAEAFLGPYQVVQSWLSPLGMNAGDFDLVVDPTDAKAYYYFERVHSELICADLTDDYTDVNGEFTTHFPHPHPPYVREAPAYFERAGKHYLITSGTTGYFPNPSEVAIASAYHGPWTVLGNPHPGDPSGTSFRSQVSSVFKHPGKRDLYIAVADRWLPELSEELASRVFARMAAMSDGRDPVDLPVGEIPSYVLDPNTSIADYVWLPIRFDGEMAYLDWHDEWRIDDYE